MHLSDLIKSVSHISAVNPELLNSDADPLISSVHYNSKEVKKGGLFVAIKGLKADGHNYIDDAVKNGAVAAITEKPIRIEEIPVFCVRNSRKALALIAADFYNKPSRRMHITGITGTNGKTTISYLLENIFSKAGFKTGVIGTINYRYQGKEFQNPMTTPESPDLQKILFEMKNTGITHVVMEVSSHAIDLDRIAGCDFNTIVFTNLTQDHLDYHETMEGYWACKKRLFTEFMPLSAKSKKVTAVINCNNDYGKELVKILNYPVISTGSKGTEISPVTSSLTIDGIKAKISTPKGELDIESSAIGEHNLENILNTTGAAIAAGAPLISIQAGIGKVDVPGRLEKIRNKLNISVFVDYAHTPDALENVLKTLKPLTKGRLICVFGCGGDRDSSKRPKMGKIADTHSDLTVITSDNPRSEDPDAIIRQILQGVKSDRHYVEPDRGKAIDYSIKTAKAGDSVIIAGKGHESYQITNTGTIDFDDRLEAKKALKNYES